MKGILEGALSLAVAVLLSGALAPGQEPAAPSVTAEGMKLTARAGNRELWVFQAKSAITKVRVTDLGPGLGPSVLAGTGADGEDLGVLYCLDAGTGAHLDRESFQANVGDVPEREDRFTQHRE